MKKGFTLIELLIVIGIIAILAAALIVGLNPTERFSQARDSVRESHINTLYNSLTSYYVSYHGNWNDIDLPTYQGEEEDLKEICNTNDYSSNDCQTEDLVDLSPLTEEGHLTQIPIDPQGGINNYGTGYFIAQSSVVLLAERAETRFIAIGITEPGYGENGGEEFSCAQEGQGEHTVNGDIVFCDSDNTMWSPTLDLPADEHDDETYEWGCYDDEVGADSDTDGEHNTNQILDGCSETPIAADQCDNLTYAGYDDWYLPARYEFEPFINSLDGTNADGDCGDGNWSWGDGSGSLDKCKPHYDDNAQSMGYWSSTESSSFSAHRLNFSIGSTFADSKSGSYRVRCVRR